MRKHKHNEFTNEHSNRRGPEGHGRGRGRGGRGFGGPGGEGRRAGRGAVGQSILTLLGERPMYGYELITALEERSGGRWRPSPGAVYPALRRLTEKQLITSSTDDAEGGDGKLRYELTDTGRKWVQAAAEVGYTEPWAEVSQSRQGELHRALGELVGPVRQIGRFGTPEQATAAEAAIKEATAKLYGILANPPAAE